MIQRYILAVCILISCNCSEKSKQDDVIDHKLNTIEIAKKFSKAFIVRDEKTLLELYASSVELLNGHAIIVSGYLSLEKNENAKIILTEDKLLKAYSLIMSDKPLLDEEKTNEFVENLEIKILSNKPGKINVNTGDIALTINLSPDEALLKITDSSYHSKEVGMTILHLRLIQNEWKIVAEYLSPVKR